MTSWACPRATPLPLCWSSCLLPPCPFYKTSVPSTLPAALSISELPPQVVIISTGSPSSDDINLFQQMNTTAKALSPSRKRKTHERITVSDPSTAPRVIYRKKQSPNRPSPTIKQSSQSPIIKQTTLPSKLSPRSPRSPIKQINSKQSLSPRSPIKQINSKPINSPVKQASPERQKPLLIAPPSSDRFLDSTPVTALTPSSKETRANPREYSRWSLDVKEALVVDLVYPSHASEEFQVVVPRHEGEHDPLGDLLETCRLIAAGSDDYGTERAGMMNLLISGPLRQIIKSINKRNEEGLVQAVQGFNKVTMNILPSPGDPSKFEEARHILEQSYGRVVSPFASELVITLSYYRFR
jgi:hypothetical protein